jgi:hypothetical protein
MLGIHLSRTSLSSSRLYRALGDIGNVQGVITRAQAAKKEVSVVDLGPRGIVQPMRSPLLACSSSSMQCSMVATVWVDLRINPVLQGPQDAAQSTSRWQMAALTLFPCMQAASKNPSSLRARDPNATAAQLRARAPTGNRTKAVGVSLSSLLQNRSEAATVAKPTFAPPPSPLPDIDSVDKDDPLSAYEYAGSIYNYYRRVEPRFQVPVDYMSTQVNHRPRPGHLCYTHACALHRPGPPLVAQKPLSGPYPDRVFDSSRWRSLRRCAASSLTG